MEINWNRRKYTQEEFVAAWNNSLSIADVGRKLNCNRNGGGYYILKQTALALNLTRDHMTGQAWNQGEAKRTCNPAGPIEESLVNGKFVSSDKLKKRLWAEGLLPRQCQICLGKVWQDKPMPLALDHINGDHIDNRLENLRILCYNCHGQTATWGRRNKTSSRFKVSLVKRPKNSGSAVTAKAIFCVLCKEPCPPYLYWHKKCLKCIDCDSKCEGLRCKPCNNSLPKETKIEWPSDEELLLRLSSSNYTALARELGIKDNAIRKRLGALAPKQVKTYCACGKQIYAGNKYCPECYKEINKVINWPSDEELLALVKEIGPTKVTRQYNVGRTTLHRRLKRIQSKGMQKG